MVSNLCPAGVRAYPSAPPPPPSTRRLLPAEPAPFRARFPGLGGHGLRYRLAPAPGLPIEPPNRGGRELPPFGRPGRDRAPHRPGPRVGHGHLGDDAGHGDQADELPRRLAEE